VFPAIEPLFGRSAHELSGANQRCCGILALRDAIFARIEVRPTRLLEVNRLFEPANPEDVHQNWK
jgi:hypothetical protein